MERLNSTFIKIAIAVLTAIAIAGVLTAAGTATAGFLVQTFPDNPILAWLNFPPSEVARNLALTASAAALLAGAFMAIQKFSLFREGKPHLTITQEIHTQPLGQSYRLVAVTATMHNTSRVVVKPQTAWCRLEQTAPLDDTHIEEIYQEAVASQPDHQFSQYGWKQLAQADKAWAKGEIAVEPNEKHPAIFQFIISNTVEAIIATTAVTLESKESKDQQQWSPAGWLCYTFLVLPENETDQPDKE